MLPPQSQAFFGNSRELEDIFRSITGIPCDSSYGSGVIGVVGVVGAVGVTEGSKSGVPLGR